MSKRGRAELRSADHFFPFGKKGQQGLWKQLVMIIIIVIILGAILYAMWQILPK